MSSSAVPEVIHFGPFEVTSQVFYNTPICYCLVNIKPILPGHVLVIPYRKVQRFTDLNPTEVTDIFTTVQKVQKMLAHHCFPGKTVEEGAFNIALQDGVSSGQTVPHVHVHVVPRTVESGKEGDAFYARLQGEEGNVGGGLWDAMKERPKAGAQFPQLRDEDRLPRSMEEMVEEARVFREKMELV